LNDIPESDPGDGSAVATDGGRADGQDHSLARADLLAAVSHEMRNTLNGLLGVSELLLASTLDPEQRKHVNTIRTCADGLRNLSVDMLDLSRMETGRLHLVSAAFSPAGMLEQVGRMMGPQAASKCLRFEAHFGDGCHRAVLGDQQRISQILLNLIGNAIKFTSGGQVSITMTAEDCADRVRLTFTVSDTGCGMEPATLETLFQPWHRRHVHAESGSGLGLAISRRLARQMHGDITVSSTPGIGSTFALTLELPEANAEEQARIDAAAEPVQAAFASQPGAAASLKVLVADDHHINRALLDAILRKTGHDVVLVDNGRSAVERALSGAFDLVLMDIQMPEVDGVAAAQEIRAGEPDGPRLPILAVTGHDSPEHRRAFEAAGMDGGITKPFDLPSLLAEVARVVAIRDAARTAQTGPETEAGPGWDPESPLAETLLLIQQIRHAVTQAGD